MEPWNIKTDDTRTADSLPVFLIFCEDQASEPVYLKYFETAAIKINVIGGQKSKMENVITAITRCLEEDVMERVNGVPVLKAGETQVWCVYDRDMEPLEALRAKGNISFDESIDTASKRGLKVAWSNDAFELWVLLHFEDIDPTDPACATRSYYYDRLTAIFKALPAPNADLVRALAHPTFDYKKDLKKEANFRSIVRPEMIPGTKQAIDRAIALVAHHPATLPVHQRTPCTLMHDLILELIRIGKKDVPI